MLSEIGQDGCNNTHCYNVPSFVKKNCHLVEIRETYALHYTSVMYVSNVSCYEVRLDCDSSETPV